VEELELSVRSSNCLRNANIRTIGDLTRKTEDEITKTRNFGKKSLDELKERLALRGFISPDGEASDATADESDLPASAELDEAVAAELDREG